MNKKNRFFDIKSKPSKKEMIDKLQKSLEYNRNALDYIFDRKRIVIDTYKYTESEIDKEELENLEYIEFTLQFVGLQYEENLKQLGVYIV